MGAASSFLERGRISALGDYQAPIRRQRLSWISSRRKPFPAFTSSQSWNIHPLSLNEARKMHTLSQHIIINHRFFPCIQPIQILFKIM